MTTNGYKLPERAQSFFDAGVNAINVSIDGLTPERFELITGKNRFEEVMSGLKLCQTLDFTSQSQRRITERLKSHGAGCVYSVGGRRR